MPDERLPENLTPDDYARSLLRQLESGATLDPQLRRQLSDALARSDAPEEMASGGNIGIQSVVSDTTRALRSVDTVGLDTIAPRNNNEVVVLRAVRASRLMKKPTDQWTAEEKSEATWFYRDFDMERQEFKRAMIDLLRDFGATLDIDDVKYFFEVLRRGEQEYFQVSLNGSLSGVPTGFSEGDLLEIRRNFIQRYLAEIPEDEDDPYNSPRLWYGYLIRPDVFCYERGEDVQQLVSAAIYGHNSQESARPDRAAYVRGVLQATLDGLDGEKDVVSKLNELSSQYSRPKYEIMFKRGEKGRGNIVVRRPIIIGSRVDYSEVQRFYPQKEMVASRFNVIR